MTLLQRLQKKKSKLVAGLMSGTSVDGIDAALVNISGSGRSTRLQLRAFQMYPLPKKLREYVLESSLPGKGSVDVVCELNVLLAHFFADAVKRIAKKAKIPTHRIDLVGSHGQTVHHVPESALRFGKKIRSSLQVGDPSTIAKLTGIPTVGDFRTADMAVGGQGAPLVPFLDYILFRSKKRNRRRPTKIYA
ncbi:MAG TPA: anhydro-N-acetylmuramic acid kinase [Bacteroidota bacterium]|nr:anhydro-N-acetylmuramic acid kinase [Bacteroidota bacterium]